MPVPESLHISLIHQAWVDLINAKAATVGVLGSGSTLTAISTQS